MYARVMSNVWQSHVTSYVWHIESCYFIYVTYRVKLLHIFDIYSHVTSYMWHIESSYFICVTRHMHDTSRSYTHMSHILTCHTYERTYIYSHVTHTNVHISWPCAMCNMTLAHVQMLHICARRVIRMTESCHVCEVTWLCQMVICHTHTPDV